MERIDEAFRLIKLAKDNDWMVQVHADVDADGIMSGAIMTRYLRHILDPSQVVTTINSFKQHGLKNQNPQHFQSDLLIVVDSLDNDAEMYATLKELCGTEIIILDHHAINETVPYDEYAVLVSSQRSSYKNHALSGAGVVWKFCKYCDRKLGTNYADEYSDLAAIGLVADMVDMRSMENRYIVARGLSRPKNAAIRKILGTYSFDSTSISFSIAPLINAANRMNNNECALNLFLYDDDELISSMLRSVKLTKQEQSDEVDRLFEDALSQCEQQKTRKMICVMIDSEYGIAGLLANKLLEIYKRPILVLKYDDGCYKGSMRATGVQDFRQMCNDSGLAKAEGHELASGIFVWEDNMPSFRKYMEERLSHLDISDEQYMDVDVLLDPIDISDDLIDNILDIDTVTGECFKPVTVMVCTDEYEIRQMSNGKHIVVEDADTKLWLIKWNYMGSFEDMEDAAFLNDKVCAIGNLRRGFIGRKYHRQLICSSLEVEE